MFRTLIKTESGYTLIETMISISLFVIIVMAGMGALINANFLYDKSHDMRSVINSLNFAMEDISRSLRTGYDYHCVENLSGLLLVNPHSCIYGGGISFKTSTGQQWIYYIDTEGKIQKSADNGATFYQLTSDEIVIDDISGFSVLGAEPPTEGGGGDQQQPFVTIRLSGSITNKDVITPFSLQTSVSHRLVDI